MVPTLVEKSIFCVCICLLTFFANKIIMTGEPIHTTSRERNGAMLPNNQLSSEK